MLTILTNGSLIMTLDQGNCKNHERSVAAPHPALHWGTAEPRSLCLVPCAAVRHSLSPCVLPPGCMGCASGLAAGVVAQVGEGGWRATDSDSLAVLAHRTTSRACSIECLHLSVLWIAIILPMEKRHIPKLGRGWEPYSSMLALALLCSTWKGSKSWSNGPGSWADRRQRCTSCFFLNREPAISFASETVQSPSHKAFSKIATGMSGACRGACDAGFWKWWDGWALRRDTVLEVNRGSNVLLCTPASNNLFSCWMLHFSIIKTLICRVLGHGQILPRTNC